MTGDADWWEEAALGIILVFTCIGPAITAEHLLGTLRPALPFVREYYDLRRRLKEAEKELHQITAGLSRDAKIRRAWDWESGVLQAVYDGSNPPPEQRPGEYAGTAGRGPHASGRANGATAWPGAS